MKRAASEMEDIESRYARVIKDLDKAREEANQSRC